MSRRQGLRRIALPLIAAAMLMLQAVGLWHGVVHAHAQARAGAAAGSFAGHDEGDAQCQLFDQLAHADIAFGAPAAFDGPSLPGHPDAQLPAGRFAPQAAGFLARGPPRA
ncbi:hypothetical protein [Piscinibacter sp.]|uniref:hypothetical protein n=1 Tax=Piscinibacter sp. TaxID=1903157 RepID=UPI0039E6232C